MLLGGIAGGLDPLLKPGDAVLGIDYLQWDLDAGAAGVPAGVTPRSRRKGTHPKGVIRGDEALLELLREALSQLTVGNGPPAGGSAGNPAGRTAGSSAGGFRQGRMLTGDTLLTDPEEKLRLRDSFAGSTVDMESASVALAADMAGVPFAAVRYVFDAADGERSANYRSFVDAASSALARLWSAAAERLRQSG
jgi:nucleoside phosphorylase